MSTATTHTIDPTLATAIEHLGLSRPTSEAHAGQLLEAFRPELERLRRIVGAVEATLGVSAVNAHGVEEALAKMRAAYDALPASSRHPEIFMHRAPPGRGRRF